MNNVTAFMSSSRLYCSENYHSTKLICSWRHGSERGQFPLPKHCSWM